MKKLVLLFVLLSLLSCAITKPITNYKPIKPEAPSIVENIKDWVEHCPKCLVDYVTKASPEDVALNLLDLTEYIENLQDYFE